MSRYRLFVRIAAKPKFSALDSFLELNEHILFSFRNVHIDITWIRFKYDSHSGALQLDSSENSAAYSDDAIRAHADAFMMVCEESFGCRCYYNVSKYI